GRERQRQVRADAQHRAERTDQRLGELAGPRRGLGPGAGQGAPLGRADGPQPDAAVGGRRGPRPALRRGRPGPDRAGMPPPPPRWARAARPGARLTPTRAPGPPAGPPARDRGRWAPAPLAAVSSPPPLPKPPSPRSTGARGVPGDSVTASAARRVPGASAAAP